MAATVAHGAFQHQDGRLVVAGTQLAQHPGCVVPGAPRWPRTTGFGRVVGNTGLDQVGAGLQEGGHGCADAGPVLVVAAADQVGHGRLGDVVEPGDEAVQPGVEGEGEVQVQQPVRHRRFQVVSVDCRLGRVGRGHDRHRVRQLKVTDDPLLQDSQHRLAHTWRRGGQLVEEHECPVGFACGPRPAGWGVGNVTDLAGTAVDFDAEAEEVRRLADGADDDLGVPLPTLSQRGDDEVFPVPGFPQSSAGTPARIEAARARSIGVWFALTAVSWWLWWPVIPA